MTKPPTCTYDTERGWCTPEHLRDCKAADCRGCRPCAEDHCELNGRCAEHVEHEAGIYTCPRCVGRTRKDLAAIVDLYALVPADVETRGMDLGPLLEEAADAGVESEAFNLVGPAADPETWALRRARLVALYERRGWCDWPRHEGTAADDPHHPYAVLGRWDMAMRESYGPQTDLFITVTSASDYLARLLDGPFAHVQEFEDFAREIRTCREHLEQITHDARRAEEGRNCPRCTEARDGNPELPKPPKLRKRYAQHGDLKAGEQCQLPPRSQEHREGCRTCAGDFDTWHCPDETEHWWYERDYRDRVAVDYVQHATMLTMRDLPERTGIAAGTLRRWAGRTFLGTKDGEAVYGEPRLKARGRNDAGRKVYRVEEVLALRVSLDIKTLDVSKSG